MQLPVGSALEDQDGTLTDGRTLLRPFDTAVCALDACYKERGRRSDLKQSWTSY